MMVYFASPYTHKDHSVMEERFHKACKASAQLMLSGIHLFCPIAHTHPIAVAGELPRGFDFWEQYDRWFVSHCDEVWVLMLEGWKESKGVSAEIEMAVSMNKPVRYFRIELGQVEHVNNACV